MICKEELTRGTISRHLLKKHQSASGTSCFLILVTTSDPSPYWLALIADQHASLADLDNVIREVWVECCGHMSAFHIGGTEYATTWDGDGIDDEFSDTEDMHIELDEVLDSGMSFWYEYDFGSTTELKLKVAGVITCDDAPEDVFIAGMNTKPDAVCETCGKPAQYHYNVWEKEQTFCNICAKDVDDECYLLPITNSPRTGICGYEGGTYDTPPDDISDE